MLALTGEGAPPSTACPSAGGGTDPLNPDPEVPTDPLNPDPLNPDPLNPDPLNPDPLNPDPLNPDPNDPLNGPDPDDPTILDAFLTNVDPDFDPENEIGYDEENPMTLRLEDLEEFLGN